MHPLGSNPKLCRNMSKCQKPWKPEIKIMFVIPETCSKIKYPFLVPHQRSAMTSIGRFCSSLFRRKASTGHSLSQPQCVSCWRDQCERMMAGGSFPRENMVEWWETFFCKTSLINTMGKSILLEISKYYCRFIRQHWKRTIYTMGPMRFHIYHGAFVSRYASGIFTHHSPRRWYHSTSPFGQQRRFPSPMSFFWLLPGTLWTAQWGGAPGLWWRCHVDCVWVFKREHLENVPKRHADMGVSWNGGIPKIDGF